VKTRLSNSCATFAPREKEKRQEEEEEEEEVHTNEEVGLGFRV
jgi:hypothetical protein